MTDPIPVYVDCDTGVDDALALAYLLADASVEVVGIGTVSGNIDAARAAENTLALLELAGREDIPVAVGSHHPRAAQFHGGAAFVHGADGVGGTGIRPSRLAVVPGDADGLLARLVVEHAGRLRVLALGPLTNLARFAEDHADLVPRVERLVLMGGAFDVVGNVSEAAEANIHNDPEAADIVMQAAWPITVVPLDVTMEHTLTDAEAARLGGLPGALPPVLAAMLQPYLDYYVTRFGDRRCALHDPLAALVVADAVTVTKALEPDEIAVVTEPHHRGRTVAYTSDDEPGSRTAKTVVQEIEGSAADALLAALAARTWPAAV